MKSKLTRKNILEDLNGVLQETVAEIDNNPQQNLSDALSKLGYPYNINSEGEFRINVTPGACISGDSHNPYLYLEIAYGNITAKLNDIWPYYAIHYHPAGLAGYGNIIRVLADKLKRLIEEYDEVSKFDKRAKLLRSLMMPSLRKNGLTKTELVPNYDSGSFTLSKQIVGNIYMFTKVGYDNYDERITKMAEAFNNPVVQTLTEMNDCGIIVNREDHWVNFKNIAAGGATPDYNYLLFHYPDGMDGVSANPEYIQGDACYNHLSKLGFRFEKTECRFIAKVNIHLSIFYDNLRKQLGYYLNNEEFFIARYGVGAKEFCKFLSIFTISWNIEAKNTTDKGAKIDLKPMDLILKRFLPAGIKYLFTPEYTYITPDRRFFFSLGHDVTELLEKIEQLSLQGESLKKFAMLWDIDDDLEIEIKNERR